MDTKDKYIEQDILNKFEFLDYGHALEILHESFYQEWEQIQESL